MKLLLFMITFSIYQISNAQGNGSIKTENQIELGLNYVDFLSQHSKLNRPLSGYSIGYKITIKNKHSIKLGIDYCNSALKYPKYPDLGTIALSFGCFGVGYSYTPYFKVLKISLGGKLCYRYMGGETAVFGYRSPPPLTEPVEARLEYNSIGFSPNTEIEFFFTKHLGLGINLNLNYYPFENAKLKGDGTNQPDPFYVQIYKPNNLNFIATFKLAYRFKLGKNN